MADKAGASCHCPINSTSSSDRERTRCAETEGEPGRPAAGFPVHPSGDGAQRDFPHHWSQPAIKQLYCRTGYNLAIDKSGNVFGAPEAYNPLAVLEFISVAPGEVQMRSVETGFYLAMDREGKLYGNRNAKEEGTIFVENYDRKSGYNNYLSRKYAHHGWYLGIKKSGRHKPGPKTAYGQKAIMFLPRQPKPSGTI